MPLITKSDLPFVRAVGQLNYVNPFLEDRLHHERAALGSEFVAEVQPYWSFTPQQTSRRRVNLDRLIDRAQSIAADLRRKLLDNARATEEELALYDDLVVYILFYEQLDSWGNRESPIDGADASESAAWQHYSARFDLWLGLSNRLFPSASQKVHLFAIFRQVYRAFFNIFECVVGQSRPAARLRANIWQSIFTHNLRRYRHSLYRTLHHVTTLVTGPSGTGKELVAQAIGASRYIPFDPSKGKFAARPDETYFAINVSAFSKNLVESELFGHAKGAFTDASTARAGWLEACGEHGSVLLDEIGELDATTQVKLLRVLQNRQFQRLGETRMREFQGKIIAATNRDLRREIEKGAFREDLYYRLCSDVIETPSLAAQLQDNPEVLDSLIAYIAGRIAPDISQTLAEEAIAWVRGHVPPDYPWHGNVRELEQCVRNIMIRGQYVPHSTSGTSSAPDPDTAEVQSLVQEMQTLNLTADELLRRYCRLAYRKTRSFEKTARLLQLDRRTVRAKVDPAS